MEEHNLDNKINPFCSTILDLPPSCIEFSPENREYFVVGTYNLQKEESASEEKGDEPDEPGNDLPSAPQSRNGSLILFQIIEDKLSLIQTLSYQSAILDLHFSPHKPSIFAVASSNGSISVFELSTGPKPSIAHLKTHQPFPQDTLVLSFSWHTELPSVISVTLSTGAVHVLKLDEELINAVQFIPSHEPLITHGLEAWCSAFSPSSSVSGAKEQCAIYSGGDDGHLNVTTFPLGDSNQSTGEPGDQEDDTFELRPAGLIRTSRPSHDAGVTAILPIPFKTDDQRDILVTGSYDDHVRICSMDPWSQVSRGPAILSKLYIGGGVWRLKFLEDYKSHERENGESSLKVLACCMHAGARILEVNHSNGWSIRVLGEVTDHRSMCYGSDVQPQYRESGEIDNETRLCVSTSFYDRLLCVWRYEDKIR
ncbi:WD40-repeat-containing domain protein [Xylogone sp. PMI_703]|nr:WD40-repeat-containing domain protein [Xylogone sp. PMI_703]